MIKEEFNEYILPFLKQLKSYKQILIMDSTLMGLKDDCFMVMVDIVPTGIFGGYLLDLSKEDPLIPYYPLWLKLNALYNQYTTIINRSPILYEDSEIIESEDFNNCLNLKAKEGFKYFKVQSDKYGPLISIMNGTYLPLNKSDSIECVVREMPDNYSYLWEYNIYKKKFKTNFHFFIKQLILE